MEQTELKETKVSKLAVLRVLLIDLDNCPKTLYELPKRLNEFSRVIACHGVHEPKIPLSLVTLISGAIAKGQLEIYGSKRGGKNAADFAMTFYAGRLMAEMPEDTCFEIWSSDKDLDHAVDLLSAGNRKAKRIGQNQKVQPKKPVDIQGDIAFRFHGWVVTQANSPVRVKALKEAIDKFLKKEGISDVTAEGTYQAMLHRRLIGEGTGGKITYLPPTRGSYANYDGDDIRRYGDPDFDMVYDDDIPF